MTVMQPFPMAGLLKEKCIEVTLMRMRAAKIFTAVIEAKLLYVLLIYTFLKKHQRKHPGLGQSYDY